MDFINKNKRKKAFICPTTHWDREWIMTFGQYRVRLVNLMDNLLEILENHPGFVFYLDGQAAMLDDYLEIKPENKNIISDYLKNSRITAGPWYVLADQFLQSGEATIRNLITGIETVKKFGGEPLMTGYVPDSFGSIASLPMILNGFGIQSATFGRGRPHWNENLPDIEFKWQSADGSEILAVNHGYGNGLFLSYPDIWTNIFTNESYNPDLDKISADFMASAAAQEKISALSALYFSVGADHMEPRSSLPEIVEHINASQDKYELVFGTVFDYINHIRADKNINKLKSYTGELRGTYENRIFEGTFTSRIKTKQLNDECDILLCGELEPLYVMAALAADIKYPHGHFDNLWKQYLLNHAHDSICGCNLDQVDSDMINRNEYILNTGAYLRKEAINYLAEKIKTSGVGDENAAIIIFNPTARKRGGRVQGFARIPKRFKYENYDLYDADGENIPSHITHITDKNKDLESVYMTAEMLAKLISKNSGDNISDDQVFSIIHVDFVAQNIESLGYKTYRLSPSENTKQNLKSKINILKSETGLETGMENKHIKIKFNDSATFDITDKNSGQVYAGLNYFADREEAGHTYNHLEFEEPDERVTKNIKANWRLAEHREHLAVFETEFDFYLPENIKNGRRSDIIKPVSIKIQATLLSGLDYIDITVKINNTCEDHCLRVGFDTEIAADYSHAFDHFNIIERPVDSGELAWRGHPFTEFVCVADKNQNCGFCVSTKGLPAYEAIKYDSGARLYIELLRATSSVGSPAGANYPAPKAQCVGEHEFKYAIFTNASDINNCLEKSYDYRHDLIIGGSDPHTGALAPESSIIEINSSDLSNLYISCIKQERDGGIIIRIWNPGQTQTVKINAIAKIREVWSASLDGQKTELLDADKIILAGKKLVTLVIII